MKAWSISTTIRNPERIPDFVRVAGKIAGRSWDARTQEDFYAWAIALRVVTPETNNLSVSSLRILESDQEEIPFDKARIIFDEKRYEDPPMRGRQQMAPLSANGLVSTDGGTVKITKLGQLIIDEKVTFSELMLNFALKFQVPQPQHKKYTIASGYCIRPFAGTLALIQKVNDQWEKESNKPVGLKWEEFCIFAPTLIDFNRIDSQARLIVDIRNMVSKGKNQAEKDSIWKSQVTKYLATVLDTNEKLNYETLTDTLRDYGDNTYRYFSQSQFLKLRGGGNYVDISEISAAQVSMLIEDSEFEPVHLQTKSEYEDYVGDLESFTPPWSTPERTAVVKAKLNDLLAVKGIEFSRRPNSKVKFAYPSLLRENEEISLLRTALREANSNELVRSSTTSEFLANCASDFELLSNRKDVEGAAERRLNRPTQLEWISYKALLAINDLVSIKPNFPMDDEGFPTFTAGSGVADLEAYYSDFNLICEVTMLNNRDQWVAEGQPVQRHLFEFSRKYSDKEALCIFIAPTLHRDTRNTFKQAFYGGYDEADSLKIIPFEFRNWANIVRSLSEAKAEGKAITQQGFKSFLESKLPDSSANEKTDDWWNRICNQNDILDFV